MTKNEFIKKIGEIVKKENEKRGNPLFSSVVIGQACLETGYGQSTIMMKANAVFGIKATSNWKGKVYNSRTREVYSGVTTNITAYFRAYDSLEESIEDYFDLILGLSRYSKAKNCKSAEECINAIANGGYATDPNYAKLVMSIIKTYTLTDYDNISNAKIEEYQIGKNYTLQVNLNVRTGPGTNFRIKAYNELTPDGKNHCTNKTTATLKKGTVVTVKQVTVYNGDIWLKIPSGYIAGYYKGEYYVK